MLWFGTNQAWFSLELAILDLAPRERTVVCETISRVKWKNFLFLGGSLWPCTPRDRWLTSRQQEQLFNPDLVQHPRSKMPNGENCPGERTYICSAVDDQVSRLLFPINFCSKLSKVTFAEVAIFQNSSRCSTVKKRFFGQIIHTASPFSTGLQEITVTVKHAAVVWLSLANPPAVVKNPRVWLFNILYTSL